MGIAHVVRAKAKLKRGGYVADLLVSGDAELGIHQISEIVPVKEVVLVGPLPPEIQNYTLYAGAGIVGDQRAARGKSVRRSACRSGRWCRVARARAWTGRPPRQVRPVKYDTSSRGALKLKRVALFLRRCYRR